MTDVLDLTAVAAGFETAAPSAIIQWAVDNYAFAGGAGDDAAVTVACSFEDAVLIDLVTAVKPDIEILFLDTQYHFAETLWYVEELRRRYDLNLRVMTPHVQPDNRWQTDVAGCCGVRKVEPLNRALEGKKAWITGLKRVDAPTRANAPIVSLDPRGLVKVNPLATWTPLDLAVYAAERQLPANPLMERGYQSIGCWPCTKPVAPGEDPRSGRWAGLDKTECGLHT